MRTWTHALAVTAVTAVTVASLAGVGTAGHVRAATRALPACGSIASLQAGAPYTGSIVVADKSATGLIQSLTFSPANERSGHISAGKVIMKMTLDGQPVRGAGGFWVAYDDYVIKVVNDYAVTDIDRVAQLGSYTCNPTTGAVTNVTAEDTQYYIAGNRFASNDCKLDLNPCTPPDTNERVESVSLGTLTLNTTR